METEVLLSFIGITVLIALSPGPDNLYVLMQSVLHGHTAGIWVTLGLCTGLIVHTTAVSLGLAAILQSSVMAFTLLKIVGALYLLYLAWQAFKAGSLHLHKQNTPVLKPWQLYRRGVLMNISNPKVSLFFLAFLPQFISVQTGHITQQIWLMGLMIIFVTFIVFSSIALLSGKLKILNTSAKAQRILHRITAIIFVGLAIKLLSSQP
ncbi:LysE family translocator [Hydrogenovibrio kuenenii]|uniref:LysE family translocator n=1 Tax=Hydrogenovibrio kuenenii TaxID=63658 RepID=UPI000465012A|nr:LysE family translocator [Hydrogenovibrio kuenenii]